MMLESVDRKITARQFIKTYLVMETELIKQIESDQMGLDSMQNRMFESQQNKHHTHILDFIVYKINSQNPLDHNLQLVCIIKNQQYIQQTDFQSVVSNSCQWNKNLQLKINNVEDNVIVEIKNKNYDFICGSQFRIQDIQDSDLHEYTLEMFDRKGQSNGMDLQVSFQLMKAEQQPDIYQIHEQQLVNNMNNCQQDLNLLHQPFFNNQMGSSSLHNKERVSFSRRGDNSMSYYQSVEKNKYEEKFVMLLIIWLIFNLLVSFGRTVYIDFILSSYILSQIYQGLIQSKKYEQIFIFFAISICFDIIWLFVFNHNWWAGPDLKTLQLQELYITVKIFRRFVLIFSYLLLAIKIVSFCFCYFCYKDQQRKESQYFIDQEFEIQQNSFQYA